AIRPLGDTVRDTLAWHLSRPAEQQAKLKAGISPEREREVLAAWREQTS
ncbi:MAG: epimerase, partial [Gammaproteobacteria bacterium]|nr:epimerase [Gammaproteobacteria bacterium]